MFSNKITINIKVCNNRHNNSSGKFNNKNINNNNNNNNNKFINKNLYIR